MSVYLIYYFIFSILLLINKLY